MHAEGVVAWINRRLILSGCFQSRDPDFDDAAQVQCRSADKIAKQKYQVTNWLAYNESVRQRGDLTIWVKDEALSLWTARRVVSRNTRIWRLRCA
uniref:IS4 family transposase n=1 Tax=Rhizobium meliloti TaxID=382 RepID=I2E1P9_RHIML|nr:IS4 family transposase [Sinorhizobium meliloti]